MKYILTILLMVSGALNAREIKVSSMKRTPGYETRFELKTSYNEKVILDCQSFIQGLFFGASGLSMTVMMPEWECEEVMLGMKKGLGQLKKYCLEVDFDRSVLDSHYGCVRE